MLRILVDDRDPASRLDDPADLAYRGVDLHRMLERLGGVSGVKPAVLERQRGHGTGSRMDSRRYELQHLFRDVQAPDFRAGVLLLEDARKAALAAAYVEGALARQVAEVLEQQLDVIDTRIDGGRKMLFV